MNKLVTNKIYFKKLLISNVKAYHCEKGVFGFKPKIVEKFEVSEDVIRSRNNQSNVFRWIENFRAHAHKVSSVNPVNFKESISEIKELSPNHYGLSANVEVNSQGLLNIPKALNSIEELEKILKNIYCGRVSAEFSYVEITEEKEWLASSYEYLMQQEQYLQPIDKKEIAEILLKAQGWDNFLAIKFPAIKRYGGEGAESMLVFFRELFKLSVKDDVSHIILGMPHRGRGNLLTTMLNTRPAKYFRKFQGESEFPDNIDAMGDVVSHYHTSEDLNIDGKNLHISMLRNPSHLEAVNPVSMGKTRSKQLYSIDGSYSHDQEPKFAQINVILHGDAAFAGQGINQECLMMSTVPHFDVGGTIHVIVNNQVGFTTPGDRGRATLYASDLAKSIQAPVFHVNGDHPELLAKITNIVFNYQRKFHKDVFIDLNCFRRWGHNELDDPTFTNPALYGIINSRKTVPDMYAEKLINENITSSDEISKIKVDFQNYLNEELELAPKFIPQPICFEKQWKGIKQAPNAITHWDTGVEWSLLHHVGKASVSYPKDFSIHPHLLKTHVNARLRKLEDGNKIDWSTAEALAIGSLMYQGHYCRISGEDVGRGTFSHRHAMLVDQNTNEICIPLNKLESLHPCGKLEIANSILSEEAVLGYEYGMAIDNPESLIIWEAQFGDFYNGAQIIVDNFLVSAETKWLECNGLVMILPHGYDGVASEHSSCRMERFLQLTDSKENKPDGDDVNANVIYPTTPAQYFHALRRQLVRNFRKPLIIVGPKTLLRLSAATSNHTEFQPGTMFKNVIGDNIAEHKKVEKIILCSGKHYYNLNDERILKQLNNVAIIRLESLCPFPLKDIQNEIEKYPNVKSFIWSQEEARNMGAWSFVRPRFEYLIGKKINYYGRVEGATTAVGNGKMHRIEAADVVTGPFEL